MKESPDPNLTRGQFSKLLDALKITSRNYERDHCLLLLMYRYGLTVTEACSLRLSDIDLERKRLYVKRFVYRLYPEEIPAIRSWLDRRAQMRPPYTVKVFFISERRKHLAHGTINRTIGLAATAAGLGYLAIHPHSLRRACAHQLARNGTDIREIQTLLRHRSISSTAQCIGSW